MENSMEEMLIKSVGYMSENEVIRARKAIYVLKEIAVCNLHAGCHDMNAINSALYESYNNIEKALHEAFINCELESIKENGN